MKNTRIIIPVLCVIPLLSGCATSQKTAGNEAWGIQPTFHVTHSTETPDAYYQLGRYYQGQNRYEQAVTAYQKVLAIDSGFVEARNGLGVVYARQGRQQEAIEQFRLAAKQAPSAGHIYNNLGYALYLSGSYAESASMLERAVALDPANQSAHTNLALALDKAGNRGKAVQVMAQAAIAQPAGDVPDMPAAASPVVAPPAAKEAQQVLALPKDWGVIAQPARKPAPVVESRMQAVQLAPNVYELRERAEAHVASAAKSLQPALMPAKDRNMVAAQIMQKPLPPVVENSVQTARPVSVAAGRQPWTAAPAAKSYRVEVSNGNGVTGMARKVAGFLFNEGFLQARLTNQKSFQVASSQVHYRAGHREQAQSLALSLPGQPRIEQADDLRGDIGIKIVLGKDMQKSVAYFDRSSQGKIRLVRYGSDS